MSLTGKKILIGMTGGIACYKVPYLVRSLRKADAEVVVVMTNAAAKFITPLTMETVSNHPVAVDMFEERDYVATRHIDLAEWADLVLVAPATANCLGKIASGVSDDLLTTIICATPRPVIFAPAMNQQMWANKVTQRNYQTLKELGCYFIDPDEGDMACDHVGVGRMQEPEALFEYIKNFINKIKQASPAAAAKKKSLSGKKIVITAGPTREQIDPVRFISNNSSGKMGYALAEEAIKLGAEVTLISGPTALTPPEQSNFIRIKTTDELQKAVKKAYKKCDCLIMAAAPADYKPAEKADQKIKKSKEPLGLDLKPTTDILKELTRNKNRKSPKVVGFALETENGIVNARKKLREKNLDMIVLNQPGKGTAFESDTNEVTVLLPKRKPIEIPLLTKQEISVQLLDIISSLL